MQVKIQPTEPHVPIQFPIPSSFMRHFGESIATLFSSVNCFQCFWHMNCAFLLFPNFLMFYVNPSSTYIPIDVFSTVNDCISYSCFASISYPAFPLSVFRCFWVYFKLFALQTYYLPEAESTLSLMSALFLVFQSYYSP